MRLLAFGAERLVLRAGRELFREGQSADCGYVIVSGNITLFHDSEEGRVTIRSVGPGAMIGEMALIAQASRLTGALAEEETEVIRISRSIFRRILEEYPDAAAALHTHISKSLLQLIGDIEKSRRASSATTDSQENPIQFRLNVAMTGTWSDGRSQPRASRRICKPCIWPSRSAEPQMWSSLRPRSDSAQSLAR